MEKIERKCDWAETLMGNASNVFYYSFILKCTIYWKVVSVIYAQRETYYVAKVARVLHEYTGEQSFVRILWELLSQFTFFPWQSDY